MNPILFAIPVFLITILVEVWLAHRQGKKNVYDIPDAITSLQQGVLSQLSGLAGKIVLISLYVGIFERYRATTLSVEYPWVWIGALIFYDFCYYWSHRMEHEVAVLWASHIVHHSSEYFNLSTALRQPSTGFLFSWIFFLPLAVAGVPPEVFIGIGLIDLLYQYWVHTELIGQLGWFDFIFVSPSNHRVHHGKNDYCIDKNYGGILIIWDRMFGSFAPERNTETIMYGIRKSLTSYNPLWCVGHYYHELWQATRAAVGWRARLGLWIAPPGNWNDAGLEHLDTSDMQRFTFSTPVSIRWYCALQYLLTVPLIMHCIAVGDQLSTFDLAAYIILLIVIMQCLGALLDTTPQSYRFELCRTVGLGMIFGVTPNWFGYVAPAGLKLMVLLLMLGSAAWLALERNKQASAC